MKTYTRFLDTTILFLLLIAGQLFLSGDVITKSVTRHNGMVRTTMVSWETAFFLASFCMFMRYMVRDLDNQSQAD